MNNLAYLGAVLVLSMLGCLVLWLRSREPRSMEARMREFSDELRALAPDDGLPQSRSRFARPTREGRPG